MIDIKAQYENMLEQFWEKVQDDTDLEAAIYLVFGESWDHYRYCKEDIRDDDIIDTAFDYLYKWDAEGLYYDPMGTIIAYDKEERK
jgi:hypothetical protein